MDTESGGPLLLVLSLGSALSEHLGKMLSFKCVLVRRSDDIIP